MKIKLCLVEVFPYYYGYGDVTTTLRISHLMEGSK